MDGIVIKEMNRHFSVSEIFTDSMRSVRCFIEKNYNKGMHSQEFYEINIVLKGSAVHRIGSSTYTVTAGDTFIIPPNVKHGYAGGEGFDVCHILLSPKYLEKHSADLRLLPAFSSLFRIDPLMREKTSARLYFTLTDSEMEALMPKLDGLTEHSKNTDAESTITAGAEALIIITRLCSIYESRDASASKAESGDDSAFLSSIAYIYESFDKRVTVDELSRIARMSRTAYITRFKRVTGMPPATLLRQYRISVAKQLLKDTDATEAEIAQETGFYDAAHFFRVFKAETGLSPTEYRKSLKK